MRRILVFAAILLAFCQVLSVAGCGKKDGGDTTEEGKVTTVITEDPGLDALEPAPDFSEPAFENVDLEALKIISGSWRYSDGVLKANNAGSGDCFCMSDFFHDPDTAISLSCDFSFDSGTACGIVFGVKNINNPGSGWYCVNVDRNNMSNTRLFSVNTGTVGTSSAAQRPLTSKEKTKTDFNMKLEIFPGGVMTFYLDGEFVAQITDPQYSGGYIGLNTFQSSVEFSNAEYRVIDAANPIRNISSEGVILRPSFDPDMRFYNASVNNETESFKLFFDAAEGAEIYVNSMRFKPEAGHVTLALETGENTFDIWAKDKDGNMVKTVLRVTRNLPDTEVYADEYRPYAHFTVAENWLNDPNGLVYDEKTATWHMYIQYSPTINSTIKHWAHSTSKDLIHWTREDLAIEADSIGHIWSGSCVVDKNNTSGLFDDTVDPAQRFVAFYTYFSPKQTQAVAYSKDGGYSWIKYDENPILPNSRFGADFRDPKVMWIDDPDEEGGGIWLMIVAGGRAQIYTSHNLIDWKFNSALTYKDGTEIHSECPDFFPLPVNGDENNVKWVYVGAGRFYVVGSLNKVAGKYTFKAESPKYEDYVVGDAYATTSYYNSDDGRKITVSWIIDETAPGLKGKNWNGIMSLPYETTLIEKNGRYDLCAVPVGELENLEDEEILRIEDKLGYSSDALEGIEETACVIDMKMDVSGASDVNFTLRKNAKLNYNVKNKRLTLTCTNGSASVAVPFAGDELTLKIVVDNGVIEVFADGGTAALCLKNFPKSNALTYSFSVKGSVDIEYLTVRPLKNYHFDK